MNQFTASLWGDEAWAVNLAVKPIPEIIAIVSRDTSPPFYYLWEHVWLKIFGSSEVAIRSLSFLFFILTGYTVYLIGRYLWDQKTGLLAASITLVNPFLFAYAFEGRMYALLALTCSLSAYFFIRKQRWGFVLATAAALYTHHFAIFLVIWEGIWSVLTRRKLSPFIFIGLLYLPWLYPLYYQTALVGSGFWLGKPVLKDLIVVARKLIVGNDWPGIYQQIALGTLLLTLIIRRWRAPTYFLLGWFWAPLLLTFIISQFFQSIFYDRYLLLAAPAVGLLAASQRRHFVSILMITAAVASLAVINVHYFGQPVKRPFRELADFIKAEAPKLTLINYNAAAHHLWESKYYHLEAPIYSPQPLPFYTGTALMESDDVISQLPDQPEIGVITSASVEEVQLPGYHLNRYHQVDSLKLLWMDKN